VAEAIGPCIVPQGSDAAGGGEKRVDDIHRHSRETHRRACRHEDALVATNRRRRCLGRAARHIACHLVRRLGGGHVIRHRLHLILHRHVGSRPRHHGPRNRSQRKAGDHRDREQPTYDRVTVHEIRFSQAGGNRKATGSSQHRFQLTAMDRYQAAKSALSRGYLPDRWNTVNSPVIFPADRSVAAVRPLRDHADGRHGRQSDHAIACTFVILPSAARNGTKRLCQQNDHCSRTRICNGPTSTPTGLVDCGRPQ
jgi:hypothetical protein